MTGILEQTYGVEVEMYHISRASAARCLEDSLTRITGALWEARYKGGVYDAWLVRPSNMPSPVWTIERDSSIVAPRAEQVELVTPVLGWDDMPTLQQVLRDLRKAGARSDPSHTCGIHVHVCADGHTARTLRNLANIMASHEALLVKALDLDTSRVLTYAKPVNPVFLAAVNRERPETLDDLKRVWYDVYDGIDGSDFHYHESRYHMLNLHSFFSGKGIEFRLFQFDDYDENAPKGRKGGIHAGQLKAFVQLCLALSYRAKVVRSSSAKVLHTDNPRYAMRCWLLRLGFIGDEFATARTVYTRRLEGDCSFRHGRPHPAPADQAEAVVVNPMVFVGSMQPVNCHHSLPVVLTGNERM